MILDSMAILAVGLLAATFVTTLAVLVTVRRHAPGSSSRRSDRALLEALDAELERARRHERPLTLARFELSEQGRVGSEGAPASGSRSSARTRRSDQVFEVGRQRYVIAPETDTAASRGLVRRLCASSDLELAPTVRTASFPEHGITSGALLSRLDQHLDDRATERDPALDVGQGAEDEPRIA